MGKFFPLPQRRIAVRLTLAAGKKEQNLLALIQKRFTACNIEPRVAQGSMGLVITRPIASSRYPGQESYLTAGRFAIDHRGAVACVQC